MHGEDCLPVIHVLSLSPFLLSLPVLHARFVVPSECLLRTKSPFFMRKVATSVGRETRTHILPTQINETNFAEVSPSNSDYSCRIINHSTRKKEKQGKNKEVFMQENRLWDVVPWPKDGCSESVR